jgi:GntR family transcriptional regulator
MNAAMPTKVPANKRRRATLDRSGPLPLYHQVAEIFRQRIAGGEWRQGEMLPSLDTLVEDLGVARVTVREAIKLLRNDGLLMPERGRGTIVTASGEVRKPLRVETSFADLLDLYKDDKPEVATIQEGAEQLGIEIDRGQLAASYYNLKRAHMRDGMRYCIISLYLSAEVFGQAEDAFRSQLALPVLFGLTDLKIGRAWQQLTIAKCDAETALELDYPLGDPIARVKRYVLDERDELIYYADVRYRSDCIQFDMDFKI